MTTAASAPVYIALVHYPVYNKRLEVISTSVTNLDIHDISRCTRTYNAAGCFIIHPLPAQQELVGKVRSFWQEGYGAEYNPDRKDALSVLYVEESIESATVAIERQTGKKPLLVATDARIYPNTVSYSYLRHWIKNEDQPLLLIFGTGYGIDAEVMQQCDMILEPVMGHSDYNHLSVRSAVAIIVDRLLGENWFQV